MTRSVDRDLPLFHALQQRGLRSRRHAIDFVYQKQVGEDWPVMKREVCSGSVQDVGAKNVRWHEVRGALHTLILNAKDAGECLGQQCLRHTRNAFQQRMTAAEKREHDMVDNVLLTYYDFLELRATVLNQLRSSAHFGDSSLDVILSLQENAPSHLTRRSVSSCLISG